MTCILVVEDDYLIREMLVALLREEGFHIIEAATGDEAVKLLELSSVRLIVTDINMPGQLNGIDLAFLARKSRPGIPVIFISGRPGKLKEARALENPAAFLQKPFKLNELMTAIHRLAEAA